MPPPALDSVMRFPAVASKCLHLAAGTSVLLLVGCSERATLRSGDDALELTYNCARPQSQALRPGADQLLRQYAILAVRDAEINRRSAQVSEIATAYEHDDLTRLETEVVRYVCSHGDVRDAGAPRFPEPGSLARDFELPRLTLAADDLDHTSPLDLLRLRDLRGRIVVVNFWATWCLPCLEKHKDLAAFVRQNRHPNVAVIGILYKDSPKNASDWLQTHGGMPYPFVIDPGNEVGRVYGVTGLPRTFIIGPNGRIVKRYIGPMHPDSLNAMIASIRTTA